MLLRLLLKDRAYVVAVTLTIAICVAINSATFAIVRGVLLRPLPVPEAERLVLMANEYPKAGAGEMNVSGIADYYDRQKAVTVLSDHALFVPTDVTVDMHGTAEQVPAMAVTPTLFPLLRVKPAVGRTFTDAEGEIGAEYKVILGYGLWQSVFGGDRNVVGRDMRLSGRPYTIVGVMPPDFSFFEPKVRLWVPLAFTAEQKDSRHSNNWYNIGRLKPGATIQQAQSQVNALNAANLDRFPQWREILINAGFRTRVEPVQDVLIKHVRGSLYLLWGGAVFVLLIGALNVASLAMARLTLRRKEMATRLALGAGRMHLARQVVKEDLALGLCAGVIGAVLGAALLRLLPYLGVERLPRYNEVSMDATVVLVTIGLGVAAALIVAVMSLAHVFRSNLSDVLREDSRTGTASRTARRVRQALVVVQVACAFVLLAGAGLLLASFRELLRVDPGFKTTAILTASTSLPPARYKGSNELRAFMERSLDTVSRVPGVTSAGATTGIPFEREYNDSVILAEGYAMQPGESLVSPTQITVTPGYFETLGIRLVSGRYFDARDKDGALRTVIVDEKLARKFWPGSDPIGRRMFQPTDVNNLSRPNEKTVWLTVVGVVRSVRLWDLADNRTSVGTYYFPYAQTPRRSFTLAVATSSADANAIRQAMKSVDPEVALFNVATMEERQEASLASRRTSMLLSAAFGFLALFLSAMGVYGVLAYLVAQRSREIGIRVALGSTAGGVMKLVMREGLLLTGAGLVLGVAGSYGLRRAVENEIYGVHPFDPVVLACAIAALAAVTIAACLWPARRAMLVDPVVVLSQP